MKIIWFILLAVAAAGCVSKSEMRRREQAAPLRETSLTEEEEKILAFPSGSRSRGI